MTWRTLFCLLFLAVSARAQLGMSISDCDIKYNAGRKATSSALDQANPLVSGPGATNFTYIFKGYTLRIGFVDGQAICVDYTRAGTQKLSEKEISSILEDNAQDLLWEAASVSRVRDSVPSLIGVDPGPKPQAWLRGVRAGAVVYNLGRSMRLAERPPKKPGR